MPKVYSVFKQRVHNISADKWQQHTKSVAKWYNCLINEHVKQIIVYRRQNRLSVWHDVGQLWHVSSIVFQYGISHMIIYWHIHTGHLLLSVHQNRCLVTCSFRKITFKFKLLQFLKHSKYYNEICCVCGLNPLWKLYIWWKKSFTVTEIMIFS